MDQVQQNQKYSHAYPAAEKESAGEQLAFYCGVPDDCTPRLQFKAV